MSFEEDEMPILNIPLDLIELYAIFAATYDKYEELDHKAQLSAEHGAKSYSLLKFLNKEPEKKPDEYIDSYADNAIKFKNLSSKFEQILIDTGIDNVRETTENYKKITANNRKRKFLDP
ncbi:hypothetical protein NEF87_002684 [Candidatus Lokiarchaeum ossiferum]|uniref:Uncharacterized protein n=1 Tax=Candidatus Lokiarchaeum ossiferum TaxID=2951803 RepID=A0ABY6HV13_9ARCH|nr:hypothetical protein NEF87_002684 [Candidatus Lokiarchaeum sp. B-35]